MLIEVKGANGQIKFDGTWVTITRNGFVARTQVGKGEKRIPVRSITAVQWKEPKFGRGFISFTVPGGNERRSKFGNQTKSAETDENTVMIYPQQAAQFSHLRRLIEDAIAGVLVEPNTPSYVHAVRADSAPPPPPPPSVPANWYPDPRARFELRYHDGARWTDHVSTGGVQGVDPVG